MSDYCSCFGHIVLQSATKARLHATDEVGNTAVDQLDSYSTNEKKRIFGVSDKNIEKIMNVVSLKNDADLTRHHNMVQVFPFGGSLKPRYCYLD